MTLTGSFCVEYWVLNRNLVFIVQANCYSM